MKNKKRVQPKLTIECIGCKRTQVVKRSKVLKCDFYTCGFGRCAKNEKWEPPYRPEGFIHVHEMNAAGGFSGHIYREATDQERISIEKAKFIRDTAIQ